VDVQPSLADGLTGNLDPDTITLDIVKEVVDDIVTVDEALLRQALAGVAAILGGKIQPRGKVAVILTGANIDADRLIAAISG
jgi:threonine dehydratase